MSRIDEIEMSTPSSNGAAASYNTSARQEEGINHAEECSNAPSSAAEPLLVRLWWLFLIMSIHGMWGIYPAVARWLQTRPAEPLPSLRLTFYINAFACASLAAFVSLPRLALRSRRSTPSSATAEEKQPMVGTASDGAENEQLQRPSRRQKAADIGVLAASLAVLAAGAITASRLTSAFIVQLIFTSSPLITAVIGSLTTHEPWPPKLWETLGLTLLGSAMVVTGSLQSSKHALSWQDPIGIVVALAATIAISIYFVCGLWRSRALYNATDMLIAIIEHRWVKRTETWLSSDMILYLNYASVIAWAPLCSALFESGSWSSILRWTPAEWAALLYQSVGVYGLAKFTQQIVIRHLGANVYAMFISLRLVFAIAGSYMILGETITSVLEVAGCVVVCLSVTSYLWVQMKASQSQPAVAV